MTDDSRAGGPLTGLKVIELASIGPGPYAAMLLADLGAEVIRVERPGPPSSSLPPEQDVTRRNRRSVVLDLQREEGVDALLQLVEHADVLIEGFRPGVTERLGLGPDDCSAVNSRLVYGRMTGWGQAGPLASSAGHDIGYIAITGALHAIGRRDDGPTPPLNLVGDFGGGSMFLVMGILAACWESARSGRGQVVDAAIVDGASSLTAIIHGMMASGLWTDQRESNVLDGGVPWYDTYATADGRHMAVGAIEPQFYRVFVHLLGIDSDESERRDPKLWKSLREKISDAFMTRTQDEWSRTFEGTDACVAPILSLREAAEHPHLAERDTFVEVDGIVQPAPAPRFSRSVAPAPTPPRGLGADTRDVLEQWGVKDVDDLLETGVAVQSIKGGS
jgi:alpha-methylacyl-CoA racemase